MTIQCLTGDVCLDDLTHKGDVQMLKLSQQFQEAIRFLITAGVAPESVRIDWRIIDDKNCAIDATIGFFTVSGNITTKGT